MNALMNIEDVRGYWVTRLLLERGIGIICLIAFLVALNQFKPLLGERGLLPVPLFVKQVPFRETPSLFFWFPRDYAFTAAAWLGVVLSCLVITGIAARYTWSNIVVWGAIYLLYLSFVNVGQTFYAFGWESILLEACFFAIFLGGSRVVPQQIPIWLFRWLLFRIMFGAGLIKMRGDSCWRDLTCLNYYYETQPMPNPLSWFFHWAPSWMNKGGVLFNHFSELIVPFAYFLPQPIAGIAGVITIVFQLSIIISGNLSWLNWLTLFLAFSTHRRQISLFCHAVPHARDAPASSAGSLGEHRSGSSGRHHERSGRGQYAFGAPDHEYEFQLASSSRYVRRIWQHHANALRGDRRGHGDSVITSATQWREYEFKGKPGELKYRPAQIAPYHLRIDWLMWFAAMSSYQDYPWFVNFVAKLLEGRSGSAQPDPQESVSGQTAALRPRDALRVPLRDSARTEADRRLVETDLERLLFPYCFAR